MVCLSQINRSTSFPVLGTQGRFNIADESLIACRGRPEGRSSALVSLERQSPPPSFVTVSTAWASRNSVIQSMQQEQGRDQQPHVKLWFLHAGGSRYSNGLAPTAATRQCRNATPGTACGRRPFLRTMRSAACVQRQPQSQWQAGLAFPSVGH